MLLIRFLKWQANPVLILAARNFAPSFPLYTKVKLGFHSSSEQYPYIAELIRSFFADRICNFDMFLVEHSIEGQYTDTCKQLYLHPER